MAGARADPGLMSDRLRAAPGGRHRLALAGATDGHCLRARPRCQLAEAAGQRLSGGGEGEGPVTPLPATGLSLLRDFDQSERSVHFSVQDVLLAN